MLLNSDGKKKTGWISVDKSLLDEIIKVTHEGIMKKLEASKALLKAGNYDHIAAGLYTIALEEFGKLLILKRSFKHANNKDYQICYRCRFADHDAKFKVVKEELERIGYYDCLILHHGGFGKGFGNNFDVDEIADLESRLAIFYSDFVEVGGERYVIERVPQIDSGVLEPAINKMTSLLQQYDISYDEKNQFKPNCEN